MKKILIVVGTRPNFIKITQFEKIFAQYPGIFAYILVHTGQHYDYNMADVFFSQLQIKKPDYFLGANTQNVLMQTSDIITGLDKILDEVHPDLVMVVGDVNSTFAAAFAAHKKGIKIAHLEAGLRSFDKNMPEENNRILTDHIADIYFVTEQSGMDNLLREGKNMKDIHMVGNTMIDTLIAYTRGVEASHILDQYKLEKGNYCLATFHRPSNVDTADSLTHTVKLLIEIAKMHKIIFPIHPRTLQKLKDFGLENIISNHTNIVLTEPLDYFSFQKLTKYATFVLTDSGGIQEETTYYGVPCLTLRKSTERPVTVTIGSNELLPFNIDKIVLKISEINDHKYKKGTIPPLWDGKATGRVVEILDKFL
ncbi:MAG: UDP-N-acetylglucosamine 2-epimerase (non-hydrolyzing) [Cytophagales bacterium]|nr:UDP-N-acetylglucosamine 2-epimerase (non-hydrolyzing) [Cytophagales bacterium]